MRFSIEINLELWDKFEKTFEATAADYLVDGEGEALKSPSAEDIATAEENAVTETKKRGRQWVNNFIVDGVRSRVMAEANAKAEDDNDTVALEGLALRRTLRAMAVQVTEI